MATDFIMPKLGLTMEAGTIREWLVADGAEVAAGTAVLVIETDKVETEVEASGSGRLHQTGVVGETYDCGINIGWFLAEGEEPPAPAAPVAVAAAPAATAAAPAASTSVTTAGPSPSGRLLASPNARRVAAEMAIDLAGVTGTGPGGRIVSEDVETAAARPRPVAVTTAGSPSAPATAAARQLADLLGVNLDQVASSDGRRTREDVARHVRALLDADHGVEAAPAAAPLSQAPVSTVPMTGMRGTIAGRMHESLHQMAQLTLTMDVDMDVVVADREARRRAEETPLPGYTDYVIAATAAALVEHPVVNSQVTDEGVALLPDVHVGMAVALDDGLMVPVVRDTPGWSLGDLAAETTRLADAVRTSKLSLSDLEGGTFSVTALGMYGVDAFTPIINPPNTAILGVGRLRKDPAFDDDGAVVPVTRLTLSLTWDHRAFDGAPAALFVRSVKQHLEHDWE